jgi:predicted helicase
LGEFRKHYGYESISKWDIFHCNYALLHHPEYRTRYAAKLKRKLPRIPMVPELRRIAAIGAAPMKLHSQEDDPEYIVRQARLGIDQV